MFFSFRSILSVNFVLFYGTRRKQRFFLCFIFRQRLLRQYSLIIISHLQARVKSLSAIFSLILPNFPKKSHKFIGYFILSLPLSLSFPLSAHSFCRCSLSLYPHICCKEAPSPPLSPPSPRLCGRQCLLS